MRLNKVGIEIIVIFEEFVRVVFDDWQAGGVAGFGELWF